MGEIHTRDEVIKLAEKWLAEEMLTGPFCKDYHV
jgi:hypothetical protein